MNRGTMLTTHHTLVINNASFLLRKSVHPGMWYGDRGMVIRTCGERSRLDLFKAFIICLEWLMKTPRGSMLAEKVHPIKKRECNHYKAPLFELSSSECPATRRRQVQLSSSSVGHSNAICIPVNSLGVEPLERDIRYNWITRRVCRLKAKCIPVNSLSLSATRKRHAFQLARSECLARLPKTVAFFICHPWAKSHGYLTQWCCLYLF
jgi:hypothetical protein